MYLFKSNYLVITSLFLTISLVSFGFLSSKFSKTSESNAILESSAISWNEAIAMRNKYKTLQPLKVEFDNPNNPGTKTIQTLEAFKISASQLLAIINNNKNGGGYNADNVVFYLGAKDPEPGYTIPSYNIIAVGMRNNALMIPITEADKADATKSSVYDKADPCPPFCPNNNQ